MAYTKTVWENGATALSAEHMNHIENGIKDAHDALANVMTKKMILDIFYPVGSYYETSDKNFNPGTAWGGTWVLEEAGRVHVSAGSSYTIGTKGGNKDAIVPYHKHDFTQPTVSGGSGASITGGSHVHRQARMIRWNDGQKIGIGYMTQNGLGEFEDTKSSTHTHTLPAHTHTVSGGAVAYAGTSGNLKNANMQPYITVNRWHRKG